MDSNNRGLFVANQPSIGMKSDTIVIAFDQYNHSLYEQANIQILLFNETTCLAMFNQKIYMVNTTEHQMTSYEIGKLQKNLTILHNLRNKLKSSIVFIDKLEIF
jgi:hypothetical protein